MIPLNLPAMQPLLTIREVADTLGISPDTVRRRDELPVYKVGKARRYRPEDVAEYLARSRRKAA